MKTTSADLLEFDALRELIGRFVASPLGRAQLELVAPSSGREHLTETLAEVDEAIQYVKSAAQPKTAQRGAAIRLDFSGISDLRLAAEKLRIEGASLEPREIFDLIALLDRAADFKSILAAVTERFPRLGRRALQLGEFRTVLREISGKVLPDGSVADSASVALSRLRREIEKQKKSIHDSLERFLRAHREEGVLQEEIVTIRNERFVVPVISGQRRKIDGVIHGASSSGHTLFVEPLETIDLNNDLVRLTEEEMRETHRILREITERLRGYADSIRATLGTMGELELLFAKARFAVEFDARIPRFGERLLLREARHPLLQDVLRRQRREVVPISLELDANCRTLLISGPNTGGKTVTLKTVGLLTLMAHSALPVPCQDAEFPIFEQVLADIGDNQSIQESLSTFSSHISRIRDMALAVTPDSLVLLDELGAATDPEEGGALGVAIVDHFRGAGAFTLISTHLLALKVYGANTGGVLNASMGFDEQTLEPTYHLRTGAPGKSAGLDIAMRLGMPAHIMDCARRSMGSREQDLAAFLSELHRRLETTAELERTLRVKVDELAAQEKALARDWEKREAAKLKELERRCDLVLEKFEADSRETIERIKLTAEQRKAADQAARGVAKVKRELKEEFQNTVLAVAAGTPAEPPPRIEEGARVLLKGVSEPARVRRKLGEDRLEVEAGFMKMQVSIDDVLEVLPAAGESRKLPRNVSFQPAPQLRPSFQEINVIGEHAEEARDRVEKFLDSAVMATASRVRIVHGHGMGILRKTIWELLKSSPHVEKYYQAPQNEGGAGATIVELKE
ncbi:MAG TPA: endonuclease MutS2 [Bryobacteraceae bacterium]|nr:endonuclease MutS2 [Bryobacteraceae bacterium]